MSFKHFAFVALIGFSGPGYSADGIETVIRPLHQEMEYSELLRDNLGAGVSKQLKIAIAYTKRSHLQNEMLYKLDTQFAVELLHRLRDVSFLGIAHLEVDGASLTPNPMLDNDPRDNLAPIKFRNESEAEIAKSRLSTLKFGKFLLVIDANPLQREGVAFDEVVLLDLEKDHVWPLETWLDIPKRTKWERFSW